MAFNFSNTTDRRNQPMSSRPLNERNFNRSSSENNRSTTRRVNPLNGSAGYWNTVRTNSEMLKTSKSPQSKFPEHSMRGAASEARASFQGTKRVTFQDIPQIHGIPRNKRPIVLNASLPHPALRNQESETKVLIVRKGIATEASKAKTETRKHTFAPFEPSDAR